MEFPILRYSGRTIGAVQVDGLAVKGLIDHEDDDDFSSTLEFQLGKMFTPGIGLYGEGFIGDEVFDTNAFGWGLGIKFMY